MIKVLDKALAMLEMAVVASPEPVAISEFEKALGINKATCTRIAKELTAADYLEQVSRKDGYRAGIRALAFGGAVRYETELLRTAAPLLRECAAAWQASVMLCALRHGQRYILWHENPNPDLKIRIPALALRDLRGTAAGLMLLAFAGDAERRAVLQAPFSEGEEILKRALYPDDSLEEFLDGVKRRRELCFESPFGWGVCSSPVFRDGSCVAAVSLGMTAAAFEAVDRSRLQEQVGRIAREISCRISSHVSIG
ncbi:IclR family transcriptional regulator [Victivallis sp. Marseille-Q1083]|uniref:IclR family transcriptional regulator n=1 Tax=Victivallis sp. Marseille-Q1083 TaxID=2717288 RepID=UPI001589B332|nr:IclR family transcriptional regulator C-terminal domain-containing protein [Victivallis sp. Marseille-Q1083]